MSKSFASLTLTSLAILPRLDPKRKDELSLSGDSYVKLSERKYPCCIVSLLFLLAYSHHKYGISFHLWWQFYDHNFCNHIPQYCNNICRPSRDPFFTASQVLSILAFLSSFVYWGTFCLSLMIAIFQQILLRWCPNNKNRFAIFSIASLFPGIASLLTGIYIQYSWKEADACTPFLFTTETYEPDYYEMYSNEKYAHLRKFTDSVDPCPEWAYASWAFGCAGLWWLSSLCAFFSMCIRAGQPTNLQGNNEINDTEMTICIAEPVAVPISEQTSPPVSDSFANDRTVVATALAVPICDYVESPNGGIDEEDLSESPSIESTTAITDGFDSRHRRNWWWDANTTLCTEIIKHSWVKEWITRAPPCIDVKYSRWSLILIRYD